MSRSQKEILESIDNRLKYLLQLQAKDQFDDEMTVKEKVKELHPMGFTNQEIAEIISSTPESVATRKSELRDEGVIE